MLSRRLTLCGILLLGLATSGCVHMNAEVQPSYSSDPARKSPLQSVPSTQVALDVEDHRTESERDRVGNRRNGYGGVSASVQAGKPVTDIFRDALRSELQNNGHRVSNETADGGDRRIKVAIKRFWSENRMNFFDITVSGTAHADITVTDSKTGKPLTTRPVSSTIEESRQIASESSYQDLLNRALSEFIRAFSRDPEILNALRSSN